MSILRKRDKTEEPSQGRKAQMVQYGMQKESAGFQTADNDDLSILRETIYGKARSAESVLFKELFGISKQTARIVFEAQR